MQKSLELIIVVLVVQSLTACSVVNKLLHRNGGASAPAASAPAPVTSDTAPAPKAGPALEFLLGAGDADAPVDFIDFGSGSDTRQTSLYLVNRGTLDLENLSVGSGDAFVRVRHVCPDRLEPKQSCRVDIAFDLGAAPSVALASLRADYTHGGIADDRRIPLKGTRN